MVAGGKRSQPNAPGGRTYSEMTNMPKSKTSSTTKTRRGRGVRSLGSSSRGSAPLPGLPVVRQNGVVETTTYRISPRRTLRAGDVIRVSGGPYWQGRAEDGTPVRHRMAERGTMVFKSYCEFGDSAWVEATSGRGVVVLRVGPERPSPMVPGLVPRSYRISKVRKNKGNGRRPK